MPEPKKFNLYIKRSIVTGWRRVFTSTSRCKCWHEIEKHYMECYNTHITLKSETEFRRGKH